MPTTAADDIAFRCWCPTRAIARELGISHRTVREYLARIAAVGIAWPLPVEVTDQELERRLFGNGGVRAGARHYVEPDWAAVTRELKRPGVTLMILWEEYRAVHPDGYAYVNGPAA
jgi:transposase